MRKILDYLVISLVWAIGAAIAAVALWTVYYSFAVCGWWALWLGKASFGAAIFGMCG